MKTRFVMAAAIVTGLGACGFALAQSPYGAPAASHAPAALPAGPVIQMVNINKVAPTELKVPVGSTVSFVNNDGSNHNIAVDGAASGRMKHGGTVWAHAFPRAGSFPFMCTIHPQMKGTIVVQ